MIRTGDPNGEMQGRKSLKHPNAAARYNESVQFFVWFTDFVYVEANAECCGGSFA